MNDRSVPHIVIWSLLPIVIFVLKAVSAPFCIPRYPDVVRGNILLAVILIAGAFFGVLCIKRKKEMPRGVEFLLLSLIVIYSFLEAMVLVPYFYSGTPVLGFFVILCILSFSLVLAFLSLYRDLWTAVVFLFIYTLYLILFLQRIRNESILLFPFLIMQVLFVFILFRSIRIISDQYDETRELLERQKELNYQLSVSGKKLMEQEKLISITRLSAGLSHAINNPLTFLQGNHFFLRRYFYELTGLRKEIGEGRWAEMELILNENDYGLRRISEVVGTLAYLSRRSTGAVTEFDLAELVSACVETERNLLDSTLKIELEQALQPVTMYGKAADFISLSSHLIELAASAHKGEEQGVISVRLFSKDENAGIIVETRDRAVEISREMQVNNRELLQDTWLYSDIGLAMCRSIVLDYDGTLIISPGRSGGSLIEANFKRRIEDVEQ